LKLQTSEGSPVIFAERCGQMKDHIKAEINLLGHNHRWESVPLHPRAGCTHPFIRRPLAVALAFDTGPAGVINQISASARTD
jgi:hypothetical protein